MYPQPVPVARYTQQLTAEGVRLLNFWRLAPTEREHVAGLLELLDLPLGATVCDLGSGTGELARLAVTLRPDLRFTLVNDNAWQLTQSPPQATTLLADMAKTDLPSGTFDAVVLAYALGHGDPAAVLTEASRLLRVDGKLLVHDIWSSTQKRAERFFNDLNYHIHPVPALVVWAQLVGLDHWRALPDKFLAPGATLEAAVQAGMLDDVQHGVRVFTKSARPHALTGKSVALQFSGGKDSLACLYLLRPFLSDLTVYWCDTGDGCPETRAVVEALRERIPRFVEVQSDVRQWRRTHGFPTDLVPADHHWLGQQYGMSAFPLTNRFDCCMANLMIPLHDRMVADGVDVVIRGTKLCDTGRVPAEGRVPGAPYDVLLPVRDWSHAQVFAYLESVGAPRNAIYDHFKAISAPECMGCTAWWGDGKAQYFLAQHPEQVDQYRANLQALADAAHVQLAELYAELHTLTIGR